VQHSNIKPIDMGKSPIVVGGDAHADQNAQDLCFGNAVSDRSPYLP